MGIALYTTKQLECANVLRRKHCTRDDDFGGDRPEV